MINKLLIPIIIAPTILGSIIYIIKNRNYIEYKKLALIIIISILISGSVGFAGLYIHDTYLQKKISEDKHEDIKTAQTNNIISEESISVEVSEKKKDGKTLIVKSDKYNGPIDNKDLFELTKIGNKIKVKLCKIQATEGNTSYAIFYEMKDGKYIIE